MIAATAGDEDELSGTATAEDAQRQLLSWVAAEGNDSIEVRSGGCVHADWIAAVNGTEGIEGTAVAVGGVDVAGQHSVARSTGDSSADPPSDLGGRGEE
jgi:hypothetical protein